MSDTFTSLVTLIDVMARAYRIHLATESLETLLDPSRPDGWVASDESYDSQPEGVSCCPTLAALAHYVRHYGMSDLPSVLVELTGREIGGDRDQLATRMLVDSYRVIGHGDRFIRAVSDRSVEPGRNCEWA